jgi:chlorite dismutase
MDIMIIIMVTAMEIMIVIMEVDMMQAIVDVVHKMVEDKAHVEVIQEAVAVVEEVEVTENMNK